MTTHNGGAGLSVDFKILLGEIKRTIEQIQKNGHSWAECKHFLEMDLWEGECITNTVTH